MKKLYLFLGLLLGGGLAAGSMSFGAFAPCTVPAGCTGWGEFTANTLLIGNGTSKIATTSAATNGQILAFLGGTWKPAATTTFSGGLTYSAGNVTNSGVTSIVAGTNVTVSGATGAVTVNASLTSSGNVATSSAETKGQVAYFTSTSGTPATIAGVATTTLTFTGIDGAITGALVGGSNATLIAQVATGTVPTSGHLAYWGSVATPSTLFSIGTTTPTVTAPITYSGTLGSFVGGITGAFGCTSASAGVTGCLTGTDWSTFNAKESALTFSWPLIRSVNAISFGGLSTTTNLTQGFLPYVTGVNTFGQVATTTLAFSGPFTGITALGATVGGSNSTVLWTGLATTSQPASSNVLVSNGGAGVYGVATTSETCTSPLSCTAHAVLTGGGAISIANAVADGSTKGAASFTAADFNDSSGNISLDYSNGQKATSALSGFLLNTDWSIFNNKVATSASETQGQLPYWTTTNGTPPKLGGVATSSFAVNTLLSYTGTLGSFVGGTGGTLNFANAAANTVFGNSTGASAAPTFFATSTLFTGLAGNTGYFSGTGTLIGTSSLAIDTTSRVGVGSTTPWGLLSINPLAGQNPWFAIGSSTGSTFFTINSAGGITLSEYVPPASGTTSPITLDWANSGPAIDYQMGTSAFTITIINATTSQFAGSRKLVTICNPNAAAGAITWKGVSWPAGTAPTQTTTANTCDDWTFHVTAASSTSATARAYKVFGGLAGAGFQ